MYLTVSLHINIEICFGQNSPKQGPKFTDFPTNFTNLTFAHPFYGQICCKTLGNGEIFPNQYSLYQIHVEINFEQGFLTCECSLQVISPCPQHLKVKDSNDIISRLPYESMCEQTLLFKTYPIQTDISQSGIILYISAPSSPFQALSPVNPIYICTHDIIFFLHFVNNLPYTWVGMPTEVSEPVE